jgi:hypothetical protein
MNLKKINELIQNFKVIVPKKDGPEDILIYQVTENWQKNWDLEALSFASVYSDSLENNFSRRLWVGENYEPKKMMLRFLEADKEFVREMFRDLFNEDKDPMGRMDRFVFHCDSLLQAFKETHRSSIINRHFHDDGYKMVSLYLSLMYPQKYAYYNREAFERFLHLVQAKFVSGLDDIERYIKVSRIVFNFMEKDGSLFEIHKNRLGPECYQGPSMNLFFEMIMAL